MTERRKRGAQRGASLPEAGKAHSAPASRKGWPRKARTWLIGVVAAALASVLAAWFAAVPNAIGDRLTYKRTMPASPLAISVERKAPACGGRRGYVIPKPPDQIGPPDEVSDFPTWAQRRGGVEASETAVAITIRGRTPQPVMLTGLRLVVTSRKAPMQGTLIGSGLCPWSGRPPAKSALYALADLDQRPPRTLESSDEVIRVAGDMWRVNSLVFPYEVTDSRIETVLLIGRTDRYDCMWQAELSWSNGETSGHETIALNGKPLHTTAAISKPLSTYTSGRWTE
jgi:hypothetical protein